MINTLINGYKSRIWCVLRVFLLCIRNNSGVCVPWNCSLDTPKRGHVAISDVHSHIIDRLLDEEQSINETTVCTYPQPWYSSHHTRRLPFNTSLPAHRALTRYTGVYHHVAYGNLTVSINTTVNQLQVRTHVCLFLLYVFLLYTFIQTVHVFDNDLWQNIVIKFGIWTFFFTFNGLLSIELFSLHSFIVLIECQLLAHHICITHILYQRLSLNYWIYVLGVMS